MLFSILLDSPRKMQSWPAFFHFPWYLLVIFKGKGTSDTSCMWAKGFLKTLEVYLAQICEQKDLTPELKYWC